jgi:hypothetical protein
VEVQLHSFLTSAFDGGEWSASHPDRFTPREKAFGTHWIRGWVGHRAVLDAAVKRKIPSPRRESNPRTPIVQPVAIPTELSQLLMKNKLILLICNYNLDLDYKTYSDYKTVPSQNAMRSIRTSLLGQASKFRFKHVFNVANI